MTDNVILNKTDENIDLNNRSRILLIEDDAINANVIQRFLKKHFIVDIGLNAVKGIELAKANEYCLVLLDINLGRGMSGVEVLHEIRLMEKFHKVPIIASTAYTMKGDKEKLLSEGFDDYISKPYTMDEINIKIKEYVKSF